MRHCLSEPIDCIRDAARHLDEAADAHLNGQFDRAEELLRRADNRDIHRWLTAIWANSSVHLKVSVPQPSISKELRCRPRLPTASVKALIHRRDGYHCRFCGMPVIRPETRKRIRVLYPNALNWNNKNGGQHAAFEAMWAQYDHIVPHAKGGANDLQNLVLACAACNFGRAGYTLDDVAVLDPRLRPPVPSTWDGLERFK